MYVNFFLSRPRKVILWLGTLIRWQLSLGHLGRFSVIGQAKIMAPRRIKLGSSCIIDDYAVLNGSGSDSSYIKLGNNVVVREFAVVEAHKGFISIGDNSFIGHRVTIYGQGGVTIGSDTMVAAGTLIVSSNHNYELGEAAFKDQGETSLGITIGNNCWIGANVSILDGVELGDGTVVAAGAVVTKSYAGSGVLAGVPAKPIKQLVAQ